MGIKKWVQHISGQGKKWEVVALGNGKTRWTVDGGDGYNDLPKSEYLLCDPPIEWEDVTEQCEWSASSYYELYLKAANGDRVEANCSSPSLQGYLYRVRKVRCAQATGFDNPDWAFIVERRKS